MTREPVVAGAFYSGSAEALKREVNSLSPGAEVLTDAIGVMSPHAGYMYSGRVAGNVLGRISPRSLFVVIGPNHTGLGEDFAVSDEDWETPLGKCEVDKEYVECLINNSQYVQADPYAHMREHSIEVQLPFIQSGFKNAKIAALCVRDAGARVLENVAGSLVKSARQLKRDIVIVASSDMTHYEARESANRKDRVAIDKILSLDPEGLLRAVVENDISMCGVVPVVIMLFAAKRLGAKKADLIEYTDSGAVSGDTEQVVGYAGVIIS